MYSYVFWRSETEILKSKLLYQITIFYIDGKSIFQYFLPISLILSLNLLSLFYLKL